MELETTALLADYDHVRRLAMETLFKTLENFSEGTVIVDRNARVVWINEHYAARFGFDDPQAVIGLDCEAVIPNSMMREVVKGGEPILLDILETDRDPIVVTRLPIKDDNGETIGAVGFVLFNELKGLSPLVSQYARLRAELISTRQSLAQVRRARYSFSSLIGTSAASLEVKRQARRAARLASPVLLLGETGTGKELLAHAIHGASGRADGPLVTVNVAAIPDTLLELEFFGAEAGAYTGADRKGRIGKFELASGGTLFLDEIGELPIDLQPKLLRLLQEREFERVGGSVTIRANVRVVAATNRDLQAMAQERTFREDLYYRLCVFPIRLPPLREREGDVLLLAEHFMTQAAARLGKELRCLSSAAVEMLTRHDWPGNIRELQNVIERAVILSESPVLDVAEILPRSRPTPPCASPDELAAVSRAHILRVLDDTGWVIAGPRGAAARLGMKRSTLNARMKKLGISRTARAE